MRTASGLAYWLFCQPSGTLFRVVLEELAKDT